MRRADKAVSEPHINEEILRAGIYGHLALSDGSSPYIIPMNYVWENPLLFLHSAYEGKKIQIINQNPEAAFCVEADTVLVPSDHPCNATMHYRSVILKGKIRISHNNEEKMKGLTLFARKYTPDAKHPIKEQILNTVCLLIMEPESMTGKQSMQ